MKGYCKCGKEIDEVQFSQFKMCSQCYIENEEKEWKEFQKRVNNAPEKVQRKLLGVGFYKINIKTINNKKI